MREIKFRVWDGNKMVYDVIVGKFGVFYVNPLNNGLNEKDTASITNHTTKYPDNVPLMQFTGLKDRFGADVYEGDILAVKEFNGKILAKGLCAFSHGVFWLQDDEQITLLYRELDFGEMQVIGNIHDNKDLL